MKNFMPPSQILSLLLALSLSFGSCLAVADEILPAVDEKYVSVQEDNPTRDAGYVVGDLLERTITLEIKQPYELIKESLPIPGYEHRWKGQVSGIELVKIATKETKRKNSTTYVLRLTYQVFTTGRVAKPASLRAEIIKLRNVENKDVVQYRIPSFSFRVSPLSVVGQINLKEEMSPFHPPLLLDSSKEEFHLKLLSGLLSLSLIGLLYVFGMHAWLPRMGGPFAKAYRDIRKLPDTPEGTEQAIARVHQSLNKTAGTSLFRYNLDEFLQAKPGFTPLKADIEDFFGLSRQVFFEPSTQHALEVEQKKWLLKFCRHLRDCERGLKPETGA